ADVDLSADEPLRVRRLPVEYLVPCARPFELRSEPRPERVRILRGFRVDPFVVDVCMRFELGWSGEGPVFAEEIVELVHAGILRQSISGGDSRRRTRQPPSAVRRLRTWTARSLLATAP